MYQLQHVWLHFTAISLQGKFRRNSVGRYKCPAARGGRFCIVCFLPGSGGVCSSLGHSIFALWVGLRARPEAIIPELACILPSHHMAANETTCCRIGLCEGCTDNEKVAGTC